MELGHRRGHTYRSYPLQGIKIIKRMLNTDCEIVTRFDICPQKPFLQTLASLRPPESLRETPWSCYAHRSARSVAGRSLRDFFSLHHKFRSNARYCTASER